jgi:excisionase family DNA binding protein
MDDFVTITEAAELLNVSTMTIRRLIKAGKLQAFKRPGVKSLLVSRSKVLELKTPRPVGAGEPARRSKG